MSASVQNVVNEVLDLSEKEPRYKLSCLCLLFQLRVRRLDVEGICIPIPRELHRRHQRSGGRLHSKYKTSVSSCHATFYCISADFLGGVGANKLSSSMESSKLKMMGSSSGNPQRLRQAPVTFTNLAHRISVVNVVVTVTAAPKS